jgi:excisionase family DNA binding protein
VAVTRLTRASLGPTPEEGSQVTHVDLYDIPGAAARLATTEWHIRALVQRGDIPHVRIGKKIRFRPTDLERYLEACAVPPKDAR